MAQGTVVSVMADQDRGLGSVSLAPSLSKDERHEFEQYQKLLRLRDEVVAGSHPRIKSTQLLGKPATTLPPSAPQKGAAKKQLNGARQAADNAEAFQANQRPLLGASANVPGLGTLAGTSTGPPKPAPGKPAINPVLLEKSEDLIKAEMQLHRQRIERTLKEQMEQRRAAQKASLQASEQRPEFDVSEVMEKAMALVKTTSAQPTDDAVANASASSDSFDDGTFYSSQDDSPASKMISRIPHESEDEEMRDGSPYEPELDAAPIVAAGTTAPAPPPASVQPQPQSLLQAVLFAQQNPGSSTPGSTTGLSQPGHVVVPGLLSEAAGSGHPYRHLLPAEAISSRGSASGSRSEASGNTGKEHTTDSRDLSSVNERLLNQAMGHRESPVVRSHDLSPVAPQPAHVSPLAVARQRPALRTDMDARRGTPAQVAALRKQHSAATSPDSSPQSSRAAEKKKNKKKKRKADRLVAASPQIKAEPRSPSPLTGPTDIRPSKRQRQSHHQQSEFSYDESRYGPAIPVDDGYQEPSRYRIQREERVVGYERIDETGRREVEPILITSPRYERVYYDEPRSAASARQGLPEPPRIYETPYGSRDARPIRPLSHAFERAQVEPASYYDALPNPRSSARPTVYREHSQSPIAFERSAPSMLPPRAVPTRIVVDSYGREYIEPPRPTPVIRESIAPEYRMVENGRAYERAPAPRAVSRRPDIYEDDAVLYRPPSPAYAISRRVVTQPEFTAPEHRSYREASHTMAPPVGEYVSSRPRLDSRSAAEPQREYTASAASARPPMEQTQFDGASGFDRRGAEERPREFFDARSASVRPPDAVRYEMPAGYERRVGESLHDYTSVRSVSARPVEPVRYETARDYGARVGSVRPELPNREYAATAHPEVRRDVMQPPHGYSVAPGEATPHVIRRDLNGSQAGNRYYSRPTVDDDVVYLERQPREVYREFR